MSIYQQLFNKTGAELSAEAQRVVDGTRQQAAAFAQSAETTVQRTMDRKGMTDRARQAVAARTYRQAQAQTQQLLEQHIAGIERHKKTLVDRAFGNSDSSDSQTLTARRYARETAAQADQAWKAMDLMQTAQQEGDTQLAKAVAGHAFTMGWNDVVDQWNHDGSNNGAMRHLLDLKQLPDTNDQAWRFSVAGDFHVNQPAILRGLREQDIDMLARDDLGGEAA